MKRLALTQDTVGSVARGHPWVYREGLLGSAAVGEPVELVDGKGKRVAWGLFEGGRRVAELRMADSKIRGAVGTGAPSST